MKHNLKSTGSLLKDSVYAWLDDDAMRLSAALSYYTVFSVGPLLLMVIAIAGLVFGGEAIRGELYGNLRMFMGPSGSKAIEDIVAHSRQPSSGILATIIGTVILLAGATAVFAELKSSMNKIWNIESKGRSTVWLFVKSRLLSFAMVLSIGFLLLVSLVVNAVLAAMSQYLAAHVAIPVTWFQIPYAIFSIVLIAVLFALIFKFLPETDIEWSDVWIGAIFTAILFTAGKFLIGLYLGTSTITSTFGASASIVLIMIWTYYSAAIVFFGAEFTKVYAQRFGSRRENPI